MLNFEIVSLLQWHSVSIKEVHIKKMNKLLIFIFILPVFVCGQTKFPTNADLTKVYTQAIGDFIKAANKKNGSNFDTLYFAKRKAGQPDDFPGIELPKKIQHTEILLIKPELAVITQKARESRIYINLMGWVNKENAEFIFVVFSKGFAHQYDYTLNYKYNTKLKAFELEKIQFKGPPFDK